MSDMYRLPEDGQSADRVLSDIKQLKAAMTARDRGRLSSTAFQGAAVGGELVRQAYTEFLEWNALFSFQEAPAAKLESDVLDMCIALAGGDSTARGNLTSGGTESNFCALAAMRSWAREAYPQIAKPNVVAPYSTHATVHKVARYLDIQVVTVPQRQDLTADVDALAQVVDENTIGIVASAPNWPYGHVDPIEQLGTLALERGIWLHVDACVGGYVLPFMRELGEDIPAYDLSVPGVRSLSADLHKYGYAPKPLSSVLWASQVEQAYHYMPITEWACGLYLSQSFVGSRPLAPVAAAWAMMHFWGRQGYLDNARQLLDLKARLQTACDEIDGIRSWPTQGPLMMIASDDFNIQLVVGGMEQRGWKLLGVTTPPAIHITLDVMTPESQALFVDDLRQVVEAVLAGEIDEEGLLSYGGVGAEEDAPKWLASAIEIFGDGH